MRLQVMRRANSAYRGTYRSLPTPLTYPLLNVLYFDIKLDSCLIWKNEAKVRRSTNPVVVGRAKVMSYENIEEARAKRAAKEEASAGKGKRSRKVEADVTMQKALRAPVARMI